MPPSTPIAISQAHSSGSGQHRCEDRRREAQGRHFGQEGDADRIEERQHRDDVEQRAQHMQAEALGA